MAESRLQRALAYASFSVLVAGAYVVFPYLWEAIKSNRFLYINFFNPAEELLRPLEAYVFERGVDPCQFINMVLLIIGLLVTSVLSFLIMREFEGFADDLRREFSKEK